MNTHHPKKRLTFGEYVASVYKTCGYRWAKAQIQLAVNEQQDVFVGRFQKITGESREAVEKYIKEVSSSFS